MTRTDKKVGYLPESKVQEEAEQEVPKAREGRWTTTTPAIAADGIEEAFHILEGRWKMVIIFHLFDRTVLRFSELERAIPSVSQKMLIQHLRELERDGVVQRTVYPEVPPKVEYRLTEWGQALCPALDALLRWAKECPANETPEAK